MRLDRLLVALALGSRSDVQGMIRKGRLQVNGATVKDPGMNVTPARDKKAPTVMDLLPPKCQTLGCMPVGRLDKDTTGLLFFTTDGELAHRLLSPKRHVNKVYLAKTDGPLNEQDVQAFAAGLDLGDFTALPALLELTGPDTARVTVQEGKFHQVKRMFEARGRQVLTLHRESFGPLLLDGALAPGQYRELTDEEAALIYAAWEDNCHE